MSTERVLANEVRVRGRFEALERFGVAAERFDRYVNPSPDPHGVDVVLLTFVLAGTGRHLMGDAEYEISGPSFAITPPGERHSVITDGEGLEVVNVYIDVDAAPLPTLSPPLDLSIATLFPLRGSSRTALPQVQIDDPGATRAVLDLLVAETSADAPGGRDAMRSLETVLLVQCSRAIAAHGFLPRSRPASRTDRAIDELRAYLDRTFTEPHRLEDLAAMVHLERTYLSRMFSARTGQTISEHLARARIAYAATLLRGTDDPIAVVAQRAGFRDLTHFGRLFRRLIGVSPRDYRRAA